eukprot:Hpha_TRINITY_DN16074_c1_g10::TRINITY_DN16074_c1_g10_i1::g.119561::m.119561
MPVRRISAALTPHAIAGTTVPGRSHAAVSCPAPFPGRVNEDRALAQPLVTENCGQWDLFAVLDGHGGSEAVTAVSRDLGSVLANCLDDAAEALGAEADTADSDQWVGPMRDATARRFTEWDGSLLSSCRDQSGVCLIACVVSYTLPARAIVIHLGDCRAVVSDPSGGKARALTEDHQVGNEVEDARIRAAGFSTAGGRVCGLEPTRTLGDADVKGLAPGAVSAVPEVVALTLEASSPQRSSRRRSKAKRDEETVAPAVLVLATDGLWGSVKTNDSVQTVLQQLQKHKAKFPQAWQSAATASVDVARKRGSMDDCSVVVVTFSSPFP